MILTIECQQTCSVERVRCRIIRRKRSPSLLSQVKDAVANLLYSCRKKNTK